MPDTAFVGWYRTPRRPWQRVCEGATHDECWQRLRDYADARNARQCDSCVLPSDRNPNDKETRR